MSNQQPWGRPPPSQPPAGEPFPVHPHAHQWPAHRPPPPKPERPLGRALLWTALFSFVGVLLFVAAMALLVFLLYAAIWLFIASVGGDVWDFWAFFTEVRWIDAVVGPVGLFIVVATVVVFAICTGVLLLLRLSDGFRRWPAPLQGLTAAGIAYAASSVMLPLIGDVVSMVNG